MDKLLKSNSSTETKNDMITTLNRKLDVSLLITRIGLGIVVAAHGAQKLFGWFAGYGYDGTVGFFTGVIGLPYLLAVGIILLESVGMIALITGAFTRIRSGALIVIMLGAIFTTHLTNGFFMNWSGTQSGEGYEFHLLVLALCSVLALNGAGAYSLDKLLFNKKRVQPNLA
jgi:putative oxidoreductase